MRKLLCVMALGLITACSNPQSDTEFPPFGSWTLVDTNSHISFVSVKKEAIAETHDFKGVTSLVGSVEADGTARVQIVLDGIESHIDVRNTRMREHLFETQKYPYATLSTNIDVAAYQGMDIGADVQKTIDVNVDMHGRQMVKPIQVTIHRMSTDTLSVETRTPIHINASDFGMGAGVLKLQELANLSSISPEVEASFTLLFER